MTDTAISLAFEKAGMKSPKGRLRDMAIGAIDDALGGADAVEPIEDGDAQKRLQELAKMAITLSDRDLNVARGRFLRSLMEDAQALNALVGEAVHRRATEYLHQVFRDEFAGKDVRVRGHERAKPGKKDGGHSHDEAHAARAAIGGGLPSVDAQRRSVPAALSPQRRAAAVVASSIFSRSIGSGSRQVGDVTRFDVIQIKRRGMIDNAIADGLLDLDWPDDKTPLSKFATESEVEAVFRRAFRAFDLSVGNAPKEIGK